MITISSDALTGLISLVAFLGALGHKGYVTLTAKGNACMTTPTNPGTTAPVTVSPTVTSSGVAAEAANVLTDVLSVAPSALASAATAQAAVAAQNTTLGKVEAAASSAFTFALPLLSAVNPALGTAVTGILSELGNIEAAFAALTGHVAAANTAVTSAAKTA